MTIGGRVLRKQFGRGMLGNRRKLVSVLLLLAIFLFGLLAGHETAGASPSWCERNEKWRGTPLLTEERYDFFCSGVMEISAETSPTQDLRFIGDRLEFEFALHLQEPRDFNSTKVLYAAFMFPTARGCEDRSIQQAWASSRTDFKSASFGIVCSLSQPGEYTLYVRSGAAILRVPVFVPPDLPTQAEYEAAERAKRPRVEIISARVTHGRFGPDAVVIRIRNNFSLSIRAIEIWSTARNEWGEVVGGRCGHGVFGGWDFRSNAKDGQADTLRGNASVCWDGARTLTAWISRVMFSDGSTWRP